MKTNSSREDIQSKLLKAKEHASLLEGLIRAIDNMSEVDRIIRASYTPKEAQSNLESTLGFDSKQSKSILEMRKYALTGLRIDELRKEHEEYLFLINQLKEQLS